MSNFPELQTETDSAKSSDRINQNVKILEYLHNYVPEAVPTMLHPEDTLRLFHYGGTKWTWIGQRTDGFLCIYEVDAKAWMESSLAKWCAIWGFGIYGGRDLKTGEYTSGFWIDSPNETYELSVDDRYDEYIDACFAAVVAWAKAEGKDK